MTEPYIQRQALEGSFLLCESLQFLFKQEFGKVLITKVYKYINIPRHSIKKKKKKQGNIINIS